MKLKIFLFMLIVSGIKSYAQPMVVSAPILETSQAEALANTVKQLEEAGKQSAELAKTTTYLKGAEELYTNVSSTLKNAALIKSILNSQLSLVQSGSSVIKRVKSSKITLDVANSYINQVNSIMEQNLSNASLLAEILSKGFKMNDAERLTLSMNIKKATDSYRKELGGLESSLSHYQSASGIYDSLIEIENAR